MKRPSPRFRTVQFFICGIFGEMIYPDLKSIVWRRHVGAHPAGIQQKRLSPDLSLNFCYGILNSSLEVLINIKVILFFNTMTVKIEIFPQISHFFHLFVTSHRSPLSEPLEQAR